jgi:hypothetical protein
MQARNAKIPIRFRDNWAAQQKGDARTAMTPLM